MQVSDDPQLLKLMLEDTAHAPDIYKPTNYWAVFEKKFLPELQKLGLHDFRRRKNSVLSRFWAPDLSPSFSQIDLFKSRIFSNRITRRIPFWSRFLKFQMYLLNKILPISTTLPYGLDIEDLKQLVYEFARMQGEKVGAKLIDEFEASLVGNPEDIIKIGEKVYTMYILDYYCRYVYCCNYIDFDDIQVMVELGSGSGKQIEVIKKLHPNICFLLFDIPPQLYVCEQYLSAVFPDSVVSYRDTKILDSIPEIRKGKIFIFGNWKFPILEKVKIDLFWNAKSFQEMELEVVANYLKYINKQANAVFLQEVMGGAKIANKKGDPGVLKQTKLEDYKNGLTNFQIIDMSPSMLPASKLSRYSDSFWKRMANRNTVG
jgi:putative sugar O-methyltransferase